MSKLYAILGEVYDRGFKDGDPMYPEQKPMLSSFIYRKMREIQKLHQIPLSNQEKRFIVANTCICDKKTGEELDYICPVHDLPEALR